MTDEADPVDLSTFTTLSLKVASRTKFINSYDVDLSTVEDPELGAFDFKLSKQFMEDCRPGEYFLEAWATDTSENVAIFPSTDSLRFEVTQNLTQK